MSLSEKINAGPQLLDQGATGECVTVVVLESQTLGRPDGTVALCLQTQELGPIAFEIDARAIAQLRRELARAEEFLARKPGRG